MNSVSKFKTRCLPTLIDYYQVNQRPPACLSFSLAALLTFYRSNIRVDGKPAVRDDRRIVDFFLSCWQCRSNEDRVDFPATARWMLGSVDLWGMDLNQLAGLAESVAAALDTICRHGLPSALENLLAGKGS